MKNTNVITNLIRMREENTDLHNSTLKTNIAWINLHLHLALWNGEEQWPNVELPVGSSLRVYNEFWIKQMQNIKGRNYSG